MRKPPSPLFCASPRRFLRNDRVLSRTVNGWTKYVARAKDAAALVRGYTELETLIDSFARAQVLPFQEMRIMQVARLETWLILLDFGDAALNGNSRRPKQHDSNFEVSRLFSQCRTPGRPLRPNSCA